MYARSKVKKDTMFAGELGLIAAIRRDFARPSKAVRLGIGDDCAILRLPANSEMLVTTDFTLEGRHFRRDRHPAESVGYRCLARGLSDLAAMGANPVAAFLSLALPAPMVEEASGRAWVERFLRGLHMLAELHHVPLAGGDTSESPGGSRGLILADIVLVGSARKSKALRRAGASAGDGLYVTGALGGAAAELNLVLQSNQVVQASLGEDHPHLFPEPRVDTGEALLRRGLATACLDISDGLSTDLAHLCRASGVSAEIEQALLPMHPLARKLGAASALDAALHGGEDYELLFTAAASRKLPASIAGVPVTRIGTILRTNAQKPLVTLIRADGRREALKPGGWEHFSASRSARNKTRAPKSARPAGKRSPSARQAPAAERAKNKPR